LVVYFVPSEVVLAPVELQTRRTVILTLVIAGVVTSLAMFIAQVLVAPIVRLTDVARRVAEGEMHLHAAVETPDEIGQLAGAFNVMTGRLSGLIGNLEDQVQARTTELVLSMAVGQRATAIRELNELLPTISEFIRELFDLYYTQVYFVDDLQQNLVLQF
jgi:methyl-accepting chemotaxis protein